MNDVKLRKQYFDKLYWKLIHHYLFLDIHHLLFLDAYIIMFYFQEGAIHCLSCALSNCESTMISVSPLGSRAFVLCREPFKDSRLFFMDVANPNNGIFLYFYRAKSERCVVLIRFDRNAAIYRVGECCIL